MLDLDKQRLTAFDVMRQRVLLIDVDYTVIDANESFCETMGRGRSEVVGQKCFQVAHASSQPCWENGHSCAVKDAIESRVRMSVVHRHVVGGVAALEEIVATPVLDEEGHIKFVVEEIQDITELAHSKEMKEHLEKELKTLQGILPICASCKKIRNDQGAWEQVESYVAARTDAGFSHSICPECLKRLYPSQCGCEAESNREAD